MQSQFGETHEIVKHSLLWISEKCRYSMYLLVGLFVFSFFQNTIPRPETCGISTDVARLVAALKSLMQRTRFTKEPRPLLEEGKKDKVSLSQRARELQSSYFGRISVLRTAAFAVNFWKNIFASIYRAFAQDGFVMQVGSKICTSNVTVIVRKECYSTIRNKPDQAFFVEEDITLWLKSCHSCQNIVWRRRYAIFSFKTLAAVGA